MHVGLLVFDDCAFDTGPGPQTGGLKGVSRTLGSPIS